jgi:hypothetical protein
MVKLLAKAKLFTFILGLKGLYYLAKEFFEIISTTGFL